jgi:hypothetical protein
MAKMAFFFAVLYIFPQALLATGSSNSVNSEPCLAPTPENFRVTEINSGDVHLAWSPAWAGATHTLKVLRTDAFGAWATVLISPNVTDSTFVIVDLEAGLYEAVISTNCLWGQPSQLEKESRFKIIDLVVGGRMPINPSMVEGCSPINMANHKWVGFRVRDTETSVSNIFEFTFEDGSKPTIKRVGNDVIVAVNYSDEFPFGDFLVTTHNPVRMIDRRFQGEEARIGYVRVAGSNVDKVVEICIAVAAPASWKPQYQLTTLVSSMPTAPPGGGVTHQGIKEKKLIRGSYKTPLVLHWPYFRLQL